MTEKYGPDHVTQIITYGTMMAKGVIRDVGRVLDILTPKLDRAAIARAEYAQHHAAASDEAGSRGSRSLPRDPRMAELTDIALHLEARYGTLRNMPQAWSSPRSR